MKYVCYILMTVAIGSFFAGCDNNESNLGGDTFTYQGEQAIKTSEGTIGSSIRKIEVENKYGKVEIRTSVESSVVQWTVTCWATTEAKAEEYLKQVELKEFKKGIDQSWTLMVPDPVRGIAGLKSDLTITVPARMKVEVHNQIGDIDVSGLESIVELENRDGDVLVSDLTGECTIDNARGSILAERIATGVFKNSGGNVTVSDVSKSLTLHNSDGHVDVNNVAGESSIQNNRGNLTAKNLEQKALLQTGFGTLVADNVSGNVLIKNQNGKITATALDGQVEVESSLGPIKIQSNAVEVRCENQNGEIELVLTNPQLSSVVASTTYNDIRLVLPPSLSPKFLLTAELGKIESDYGEANPIESGPPIVQLQTRNGNLIIRKAAE